MILWPGNVAFWMSHGGATSASVKDASSGTLSTNHESTSLLNGTSQMPSRQIFWLFPLAIVVPGCGDSRETGEGLHYHGGRRKIHSHTSESHPSSERRAFTSLCLTAQGPDRASFLKDAFEPGTLDRDVKAAALKTLDQVTMIV